jgi:hypothetical protein
MYFVCLLTKFAQCYTKPMDFIGLAAYVLRFERMMFYAVPARKGGLTRSLIIL